MVMIFGVPSQLLLGQVLIGLINGAFYAILSLGLSVIFGMLNVVNFAHGVQFMLGALFAWMLLHYAGIGFWGALVLAPILVGLIGIVIEVVLIRRLYNLDHIYGLILTFGLALIIEGLATNVYGSAGLSYDTPDALQGAVNLGFMVLPLYRGFVVVAAFVVCMLTYFAIEGTPLGARLRAASENPSIVFALGLNVPFLRSLTYGAGALLAAFAGVLAAPLYSVNPNMGSSIMIVVFAVVVIGGMGTIMGSVVSGVALGVIEGLTKVYWPEASDTVVFLAMAIVLMFKPAGLFGREI